MLQNRSFICFRLEKSSINDLFTFYWGFPVGHIRENKRLYNYKLNARALIGQSAMVYCDGKPMEKSRVFAEELSLIKVIDVKFIWFIGLGCWQNTRRILLVFYQHPAWFIRLYHSTFIHCTNSNFLIG